MLPPSASPPAARVEPGRGGVGPATRAKPERRSVGLAVGMLLLVASGCAASHPHAHALPSAPVLPAGDPAAALPRDDIDLLVWNVKKAERAAWRREFEALVRGKELVLLQEAYVDPRMLEGLAVRPELQWLMSPSFAFAWRRGTPATGVAIGSVASAVWHQELVTVDTEPLVGTPKATLAVTYELEGSAAPLLVVCVHGINFRPVDALAAQLGAIEPVMREHRGPMIFAGDLNTHHRARMEAVEAFAGRLGLESAFDNRRRRGRDRSGSDGRTRYRSWPLDHVYVRGLVVEEARVVEAARGSDHQPLILRVSSE